MKINKKLLPIKLHFFFFMAAMGPILPQLPLIGKDLGISSTVMGTVNGVLPFTFLLVKPLFGLLVDVYRQCRKTTFMLVIVVMTLCYAGIYFIPFRQLKNFNFNVSSETFSSTCDKDTVSVVCNSSCVTKAVNFSISVNNGSYRVCSTPIDPFSKSWKCSLRCIENSSSEDPSFYKSFTFWSFIVLMSLGTIGFNVINSISDAICFDIVDDQANYGEQRLWGSIGFGLAGLVSGYLVDLFSKNLTNYEAAYIVMTIFSILDLLVCFKLEIPIIESPKNVLHDLKILLRNEHVVTFIIFTIFAGIFDGLLIYFLFWYLEDLALQTNTTNVKLIEGLILAAETLGAEVLFFRISGKILQHLGHVCSFSLCFFNYALRLWLVSVAPSPWWMLPIEFLMQGPTFALTYTAIVAYANELAPPGMSATMQGIASGMGDGTGYAIGGVIGGVMYRYFGGKVTFQIFAGVALLCGVLHFLVHKVVLDSRTSHRRMKYQILE